MSSSRSTCCCYRHGKRRNTREMDQHLVSYAVSPALKSGNTSPLTPSKRSTSRSERSDSSKLEIPKQKPKSNLQLRSADEALLVNPQKLKQRNLVVNSDGQYFFASLAHNRQSGWSVVD
ncbi:hypothetical protein M3Y94_00097300 [Aphelenchoides besseyi]|nr:hypothetical protein M3Y94_00097300 [Aphelenchoides besseyi]